jgi:hypothetical protein
LDGTITLGDYIISDNKKVAAIKQALEGDNALGTQLLNLCRNDSPLGIMACI